MLQEGKEPAFMRDKAGEMKFWKTIFDRYDSDKSNTLDFEEITAVVRNDLKIAERTLTKVELREFYSQLDQNKDQVGQALRVGLRRIGVSPVQAEEFVRSLPEASETIDQPGFFRLFRRGLKIDRNDPQLQIDPRRAFSSADY
eukprot:g33204.t1